MSIEIRPYDPDWPRQFDAERARIQQVLGARARRIDHHGSTAVPGLAAKPVIDIQVSVDSLQPIAAYASPLASLGYVHVPHADDEVCPFFHRPAEWPHTHHVHVVTAGGHQERRTLAFRDYLRAHPDAARDYEDLKRRLAAAQTGTGFSAQQSYADAKTAFVEKILDAAAVDSYYAGYEEEHRLRLGPFQLEFERTKEILARALPPPPARVVDVGGAAGAYSLWLAEGGYEVHLVDASARLVDEARRRSAAAAFPIASLTVGNAMRLPLDTASADAVLVMGPLYHLTHREDRIAALREARRVVTPGGVVAVAAISRYASALDGLVHDLSLDPVFAAIRDRDLEDGQHRNDANHPYYFTTAYFHLPEDLHAEMEAAGLDSVSVLGVEGPGWLFSDFEVRWNDPPRRGELLAVARRLEAAPSALGLSAHLLGLARTPVTP
jgi:GrpB-like predicted nucleotidyltransferase (UPF0157 family)/ubiquinone/menaquinone biosynthesis C-methylase UbiE